MLFTPSISQPAASATENNSNATTTATENNSAISTYSTTPTVGISLPTSINFADVLPTPSGATTTATADLTITTTDSAGYSLYLYSSDGDNSLKHKISSLANISQINATAGGVGLTLSSLKPNTWGYNLGTEAPTDSTTYSAVPTDNSTPIQTKDTSDTNSANDTYTLSFGAKVDSAIASGAYSNALTVAVVATPREITLSDLSYMQDMTPEICAASTIHESFRLTDSRDGTAYWVTKLADGNCWMTQDLALDLTASGLSSADTDIASNWNSTSVYPPRATSTSIPVATEAQTTTASWDPGEWVLNTPGAGIACDNSATSLGNCASSGFVNVSGWEPTYVATGSGTTIQTTDAATQTYDAHYLVGNYYSYNAATAGTGGNLSTGDAAGSICPKGWHLPDGDSSANGSYAYLLAQYGITSSVASADGMYNVAASPLYFVRSGIVNSAYGTIRYAGVNGYYRTSTAAVLNGDAVVAYDFYFNDSTTTIQRVDGYRYTGRPVRCLAR